MRGRFGLGGEGVKKSLVVLDLGVYNCGVWGRGGGTGRRTGLKIRRPCGREGSTPSFGTIEGIGDNGGGLDINNCRRVAQLAERCLDMAEVTGSNPVAPTEFKFGV